MQLLFACNVHGQRTNFSRTNLQSRRSSSICTIYALLTDMLFPSLFSSYLKGLTKLVSMSLAPYCPATICVKLFLNKQLWHFDKLIVCKYKESDYILKNKCFFIFLIEIMRLEEKTIVKVNASLLLNFSQMFIYKFVFKKCSNIHDESFF